MNCHCNSGSDYSECCGRFLEQKEIYPDSCTELMRSRYSAFKTGRVDYLLETWHPETKPELDSEPTNWIYLEILGSTEPSIIENDDDEEVWAEVEFLAKLLHEGKLDILHERSSFQKIDGNWFYHSGDFLEKTQEGVKVKKSTPCPCGSGKLFKNCKHENI